MENESFLCVVVVTLNRFTKSSFTASSHQLVAVIVKAASLRPASLYNFSKQITPVGTVRKQLTDSVSVIA